MNFTTPELVAIREAELHAQASAERLARLSRVTAWARREPRHLPVASLRAATPIPGPLLRAPRL
jgi:hypothetical protein